MLAYRITKDINEIKYYCNNKIYYDNEQLFDIKKKSLYEVNTFPNKDGIYKYFYYFPYDAYEIARLFLNLNDTIDNIYILEYEINNDDVIDKVGFGNYKRLRRCDYIPENRLYKIYPYINNTYPVIELRLDKTNIINTTGNIYRIDRTIPFPSIMDKTVKKKEYILYKLYLEKVLNDFNINYPNDHGLMIISKNEGNVKKLTIPKNYQRLIY